MTARELHIYTMGELVAIRGDPYVIWKIVDLVSNVSGKLGGPGVALRPAYWSTSVTPAGEVVHRLRLVNEMEVIALMADGEIVP